MFCSPLSGFVFSGDFLVAPSCVTSCVTCRLVAVFSVTDIVKSLGLVHSPVSPLASTADFTSCVARPCFVHVLTHVSFSPTRCSTCCAWYAGYFSSQSAPPRAARESALLHREEARLQVLCWRVVPATAWTVRPTGVATVWAWKCHVAIPLVVHSCARASASLR